MPNRILKESITTSDTLDQLSADEERMFYRLMVVCDDYGRFDARPLIVLGKCFPLRIGVIKPDHVSGWIDRLEAVGLLWRYRVGGRTYLQITTWDSHQQKRAKNSKWPEPPADAPNCDSLQASDITCNQVPAIVPEKREARSENREYEKREARSDSGADAPAVSDQVREVWTYYREHIQPQARVCPSSRIKTRLKRFSTDDLKLAIDRFAANYWWMSRNAKQGGDWFFTSDGQIDRFLLLEPESQEQCEARERPSTQGGNHGATRNGIGRGDGKPSQPVSASQPPGLRERDFEF